MAAFERPEFGFDALTAEIWLSLLGRLGDDLRLYCKQFGRVIVKTIVIILTLAISGIATSATYTTASADSRMSGSNYYCSSGSNCMSDRYQAAMKKKGATAKPKTVH
jgi:hypothetical protein